MTGGRRDAAQTPAGELAHGHVQWLEIGMVLANRPKVILLDVEHDMHFVRWVREQITVLHKGTGQPGIRHGEGARRLAGHRRRARQRRRAVALPVGVNKEPGVVSMSQVAAAAGVSPATVSRVLSNSPYPVRPETRQRVLDTAAQLGFRPNLLARALATSRTAIVAVIVHDISDPYFAEIVRGVEDIARTNGYQVLVSSSDRDPARELEILQLMVAYNVDAVVFSGGSLADPDYQRECKRLVEQFTDLHRAVVHLGPHHIKATRVAVDNEAAAADMTRYLAELGHRRIGFLAGPVHLSTAGVRTDGYRKGLGQAGIAFDGELVVDGRFTSEGGRAATAELLDRHPDITAIFASNDLMALGAMSELVARGIRVPEMLSVAGFDDVQLVQYVSPPLTTVAVPLRRLGQVGFEVALKILEGQPVRSRTLPTKLVIRASTGPPPAQPSGRRRLKKQMGIE